MCIWNIEVICRRSQIQVQWYAVTRCVAVMEKMIGLTLDYTFTSQRQWAPIQTDAHVLSWNKLSDCSSIFFFFLRSQAIWMEMRNESAFARTRSLREQLWTTPYENRPSCASQLEVERSVCVLALHPFITLYHANKASLFLG